MFKLATTTVAVLALTLVASAPKTASAAEFKFPGYGDDCHEVHVDYSLNCWKSKHMHDHHGAHELANFLRSAGCFVRIAHNGGHYDVQYMCPRPRSKYFHCDSDAHQFERSLRRLGFDARVHH
ncbi:MAG: hypothetical protein WD875_13840 [Pirellulales bacterium]